MIIASLGSARYGVWLGKMNPFMYKMVAKIYTDYLRLTSLTKALLKTSLRLVLLIIVLSLSIAKTRHISYFYQFVKSPSVCQISFCVSNLLLCVHYLL